MGGYGWRVYVGPALDVVLWVGLRLVRGVVAEGCCQCLVGAALAVLLSSCAVLPLSCSHPVFLLASLFISHFIRLSPCLVPRCAAP